MTCGSPYFAFHAALAARWATTSVERTTRDAGQAGVRLRCFLDLHPPLKTARLPR
jgi:hypothetical protein